LTVMTERGRVVVAVLASDPLACQGVSAYLETCPEVRLVPSGNLDGIDVVLVVTDRVSRDTLELMQGTAAQARGREIRFVLVCDAITESQLLCAMRWGMVSILLRGNTNYEQIVRAVVHLRDGRAEMPGLAPSWLQSRIRGIQRDVLEPRGLTTAGLLSREVDVLRLLAEGMDTLEVASRLNYSERTVRNIIHGVLTRLQLRNRVHAVAYAYRNGVI